MGLQRLHWKLQRLGWFGMVVVLGAALLGLTGGHGMVSKSAAREAGDGAEVEYGRFVRWRAPSEWTVRPVLGDGGCTVWIGHDLLAGIELARLTPEPSSAELVGDGVLCTFSARHGAELCVALQIVPKRVGVIGGRIGTGPDSAPTVRLLAFP